MKNQQGAPEALRLADLLRQQAAYHREVASDCDMRAENTINWGHGEVCCRAADELLRLHAYCQELEAQVILDCMTHGQQSAEIEHVVGDVSKNGAESNMAQQPAPSEQQPFGWIKQSEIDSSKDFGGSISLWRQKYDCDVPVYLAQQPAPSAAHVVADALADSQYLAGVSAGWNAANADNPNEALRKLHESRAGYLKPLRAARAPADSVTAPAGGVVEDCRRCHGSGEDPEGYYDQSRGDGGETLDGPCRECDGTGIAQPTPPAQVADSVLEDTARLDWLDQNIFYREMDEWDAKHGGRGDCTMWVIFAPKGHQGSARNIIDAARKQGGA